MNNAAYTNSSKPTKSPSDPLSKSVQFSRLILGWHRVFNPGLEQNVIESRKPHYDQAKRGRDPPKHSEPFSEGRSLCIALFSSLQFPHAAGLLHFNMPRRPTPAEKQRVRTGCLTCRRRRRKCKPRGEVWVGGASTNSIQVMKGNRDVPTAKSRALHASTGLILHLCPRNRQGGPPRRHGSIARSL